VVADDSLYATLMHNGHVVLPLTFLPAKADLEGDAQPVIDRVVAMLRQHPDLVLEIDGHTDNTGDPRFNEMLSKERAMTVRGLLIDARIARKRLVAVGLGGSEPITQEKGPAAREKNRRIELVVRSQPVAAPEPAPLDPPVKLVVRKQTAPPPPPAANVSVDSDPGFHAAAPDGVNYYPKTTDSSPH
jgi:hypothetical protein